MARSEWFKLLLQRGYFPSELPPPFSTDQLAKYRTSITNKWTGLPSPYPSTIPEIYSIPRPSRVRRNLAIINPIAQVHLCKLISDDWVAIRKHLRARSYSVDVPDIKSGKRRAVSPPDFSLLTLRQGKISSQFDHVLVSDISRFYGTLYTHAIPWALHGKEWCKTNLNRRTYKESLGNRLDIAIRSGQDSQSVGIPVGPDSSRIISEIVGVSIDQVVQEHLKLQGGQACRHVDDWFIGFDNIGDAEDAVSSLAIACRKFEMELNPEKTRTFHASSSVGSLWPHEIGQFSFEGNSVGQKKELDHYFTKVFRYSVELPNDNVLEYAIKRTRDVCITTQNWPTYEMYLLKAARSSATVIPSVVQLLSNYCDMDYPIGKDNVLKLVQDIILKNAPLAHHAEVSWALFMVKTLGLKLSRSAAEAVSRLASSVCALLALDIEGRGQITGTLDKTAWRRSMSSNGLRSNMWLLAYEADLKGWLHGLAVGHVEGDPYFSELKGKQISFYDTTKNVELIGHGDGPSTLGGRARSVDGVGAEGMALARSIAGG